MPKYLICILFLTIITTILLNQLIISKSSPKIFVATNGSDENKGTRAYPFRSIQHAIDISEPGTTIYIKDGIYYELITIENYGHKESEPLIVKADNNVIIDGSRRNENQSKHAAFKISESYNIVIDGFEIQNITTDDADFYPAGILINDHSENITIKDNNIHHIANIHKEGNAHGIIVYGNSATPILNIGIFKNKIHHLQTGSSESLTISGNVSHFKIERNVIHNNNNIGIDIAGYYGACNEPNCIDIARNGTISYNRVSQNSSATNPSYEGSNSAAGIYVDGGQKIKITHNIVKSNDFGISISSENNGKYATDINIEKNLILKNEKAGLVLGGSTVENGGTDKVFVTRNIFFNNDLSRDGYMEITIQQYNNNISLYNNRYFTWEKNEYLNDVSNNETPIIIKNEKIFSTNIMNHN